MNRVADVMVRTHGLASFMDVGDGVTHIVSRARPDDWQAVCGVAARDSVTRVINLSDDVCVECATALFHVRPEGHK